MYPYAPLQYLLRINKRVDLVKKMTDSLLPPWEKLDQVSIQPTKDMLTGSWDLTEQFKWLQTWLDTGDGLGDIAFEVILLNNDVRRIVNAYIYRHKSIEDIQATLSRTGYGTVPPEAIRVYLHYFWRWELVEPNEMEKFINSLPAIEGRIYERARTAPDFELDTMLKVVPDVNLEEFLQLILGYGMTHLRTEFYNKPRSLTRAMEIALKAADTMVKLQEQSQDKDKTDLATLLGLRIQYDNSSENFPTLDEIIDEDQEKVTEHEAEQTDQSKGELDGSSEDYYED